MIRACNILLAAVLLGPTPTAASPQETPTVTTTITLRAEGRKALIDRAAAELKASNPDFDPAAYDQVQVRASSSQVWVSFATSIVLLREGQRFATSRSVELVGKVSTGGSACHPHDLAWDGESPPFVPDAAAERDIAFVLAAIEKSPDVGSVPDGKLPTGTQMIIRDTGDHFEVSVADEWMDSSYRVSKIDGTISNAMHAHSIPAPEEDGEEFEEITE